MISMMLVLALVGLILIKNFCLVMLLRVWNVIAIVFGLFALIFVVRVSLDYIFIISDLFFYLCAHVFDIIQYANSG